MGLETHLRLEPQVCIFIFIFIAIDYLQIDSIVQKGAETTTTGPGMFLFFFFI